MFQKGRSCRYQASALALPRMRLSRRRLSASAKATQLCPCVAPQGLPGSPQRKESAPVLSALTRLQHLCAVRCESPPRPRRRHVRRRNSHCLDGHQSGPTSATGELDQDLAKAGTHQPMPSDAPKSKSSSRIKSQPQVQALAASLQGDTVCFLSRSVSKSSPSNSAYSEYTRSTASQNAASSTMSSRTRSDNLDVRSDEQFETSDCPESTPSSTTSRSTGRYKHSAESAGEESFEPTQSTHDVTASTLKSTRLDVTVTNRQPLLRTAFATTVRAVIGAIFRGSDEYDLTVEAELPGGPAEDRMPPKKSSSVVAQRLLPPSPHPPPPQSQPPTATAPKGGQIKVIPTSAAPGKPSAETRVPANDHQVGPPTALPAPSLSMNTGSPMSSGKLESPERTSAASLDVPVTSTEAPLGGAAPATAEASFKAIQPAEPDGFYDPPAAPLATTASLAPPAPSPQSSTQYGPTVPLTVPQQTPQFSSPVSAPAYITASAPSAVTGFDHVPDPTCTPLITDAPRTDVNSEPQRTLVSVSTNARVLSAQVTNTSSKVVPGHLPCPSFPSASSAVSANNEALMTALLNSEAENSDTPHFSLPIPPPDQHLEPLFTSASEARTPDAYRTISTTLLKSDVTGSPARDFHGTPMASAKIKKPPGTSPVVSVVAPVARTTSMTPAAAPTEQRVAPSSVTGADTAALAPIAVVPLSIADSPEPYTARASSTATPSQAAEVNVASAPPQLAPAVNRLAPALAGSIPDSDMERGKSSSISSKGPEPTAPGVKQEGEIADEKLEPPSPALLTTVWSGTIQGPVGTPDQGAENLVPKPSNARDMSTGSGETRRLSTHSEVAATPLKRGSGSDTQSKDTAETRRLSLLELSAEAPMQQDAGSDKLSAISRSPRKLSVASEAASASLQQGLDPDMPSAVPGGARKLFQTAEVEPTQLSQGSGPDTQQSSWNTDTAPPIMTKPVLPSPTAPSAADTAHPASPAARMSASAPVVGAVLAAPPAASTCSESTIFGHKKQIFSSSGAGAFLANNAEESQRGADILKQIIEEEYTTAVPTLEVTKLAQSGQHLAHDVPEAGPLSAAPPSGPTPESSSLQGPEELQKDEDHAAADILQQLIDEEYAAAAKTAHALSVSQLGMQNQMRQSPAVVPVSAAPHFGSTSERSSLPGLESQKDGGESEAAADILKQLIEEEYAAAVKAAHSLQMSKLAVRNQTEQYQAVDPHSAVTPSEDLLEASPLSGPRSLEKHVEESQAAADILKKLIDEEYAAAVKAANSLQMSKLSSKNKVENSTQVDPLSVVPIPVPMTKVPSSLEPGGVEKGAEESQAAADILRQLMAEEYAAAAKSALALQVSHLEGPVQQRTHDSTSVDILCGAPTFQGSFGGTLAGPIPEVSSPPPPEIPAKGVEECPPDSDILKQLIEQEYAAAVKAALALEVSQLPGPVKHQTRDSPSVGSLSAPSPNPEAEECQADADILKQLIEQEYAAAVKAALVLEVSQLPEPVKHDSPSIGPLSAPSPNPQAAAKSTEEWRAGADILKRLLEEEYATAVKATRSFQTSKLDVSKQHRSLPSQAAGPLPAMPPSRPTTEVPPLAASVVSEKATKESQTDGDMLKHLVEEYVAAIEAAHALQAPKRDSPLQNQTRLSLPVDTFSTLSPSGHITSEDTFPGPNIEVSSSSARDISSKGVSESRTEADHLEQILDKEHAPAAKVVQNLLVSRPDELARSKSQQAAIPLLSHYQLGEEASVMPVAMHATRENLVAQPATAQNQAVQAAVAWSPCHQTGTEAGAMPVAMSAMSATPANVVVEAARKILAAAYEMLGLTVYTDVQMATRNNQGGGVANSILAADHEYPHTREVTLFDQRISNMGGSMLGAAPGLPSSGQAKQNIHPVGAAEKILTATHDMPTIEQAEVDKETDVTASVPLGTALSTATDAITQGNQPVGVAAAMRSMTTTQEAKADKTIDVAVGGTSGPALTSTTEVRAEQNQESGAADAISAVEHERLTGAEAHEGIPDAAPAKPPEVAVPQTRQPTVSQLQYQQTAHIMRSVFPGVNAFHASAPAPVQQHNVRVAQPSAVFPGALQRWPALAASAAAPTAAAPSAVVPTQRPMPGSTVPGRMQGSLLSMPPRMVPPLTMPGSAWSGLVVGGVARPLPGAPIAHMLAHQLPSAGMATFATTTQYAEISWSRVAVSDAPFSVAPGNVCGHHTTDEETLEAGGEGAPRKLLETKSLFQVVKAKSERAKADFEVANAMKPTNSGSSYEVKATPRELRECGLRTAAAAAATEGPAALLPFLESVLKKLTGKVSLLTRLPKLVQTAREVELDSSNAGKFDILLDASVLPIFCVETRLSVAGKRNSQTVISPAPSLSSQRDSLGSRSIHANDSSFQTNSTTKGHNQLKLSTEGRKSEPQPRKPQSPMAYVVQPAGASASDVIEACRVSPQEDLAQTLSAEGLAGEAEQATSQREVQYAASQHTAAPGVSKSSTSNLRAVTAPTIPTNNGGFPTTDDGRANGEQIPFQEVIERRSTENSPSLLECAERPASGEKQPNVKKKRQSKKREIEAVPEVVSPEIEAPEERANIAYGAVDINNTRVNREDLSEDRAAVVLSGDEPHWSLLACALILVGVILMSLIALIYASTMVLPPTQPTQPAPSVSSASGIIYCSSEFCDREADYIGSLLGASGKGACENFYEHVCGAWSQAHPLGGFTGAGAAISTDTVIQDTIDNELVSLLRSNRPVDVAMAFALYDACADRNKADTAINQVKELFKAWKIGIWPRDANSSLNDIWEFAGELMRDLGLSSIVDIAVGIGGGDNDNTVVELRQPDHILSCNDAWRVPVMTLFHSALSDLSLEFTHAPKVDIMDEVMNAFIRLSSCPASATIAEPNEAKFGALPAGVAKLSELQDNVKKFLVIAFEGVAMLGPDIVVVLKPATYVRDYLPAAMGELPPRALMNYMGLLALVHLAPLLPERHVHLRQLFVKALRGRTLPNVSNSSTLCLMAVESALPACFNKLSASLFRAAEYNVRIPEKLAQLEDAFARNVRHLIWISDELALVNRYRLKRRHLSHFGPSASWNAYCTPLGVVRRTESPVQFYRDVRRAQRRSRLEPIVHGRSPGAHRVVPSSVRAVYDRLLRRVLVPAALFNATVPGNSAGFSLQLARYAVRFYHALQEALLLDDWDRGRDDVVRRKLQALLQCFESDLQELPAMLRGPAAPDPAWSRAALLQQTTSLQFAFRAFQDLWQVRRAWNADFRYRRLPSLSADALFFVYYALDNCENSDPVYKGDQRLPAEHRVNLPLRHLAEFAPLFNCSADTPMGRPWRSCTVVTPDTWSLRAPAGA